MTTLSRPLVFDYAFLILLAVAAIYVGARSLRANTGNATTLSRWPMVGVMLSGICALLVGIAAIARLLLT